MPNTAIFVDITNKELENSVKFSNLTIEKFEVKNEVATGIYETGNLIKCDIVFFANGKRYVGNKRLYSNYQNTITGETKNDVEPNSAYFVKVSVLGNTESATEDFDFDVVLLGEKEELELQLFYEREDLFGVIGTFTTNEDSLYSVDSLKVFPYDYLANSSSQNVIVDDKLSTSSENPVQNKVITKALEDIYLSDEKIIIDDELDSQSTNPVQNKAVADAVESVNLPRDVRVTDYDSNSVTVAFETGGGNTCECVYDVDLTVNGKHEVFLYKFVDDGEYRYALAQEGDEPDGCEGRVYAFTYKVTNGAMHYLAVGNTVVLNKLVTIESITADGTAGTYTFDNLNLDYLLLNISSLKGAPSNQAYRVYVNGDSDKIVGYFNNMVHTTNNNKAFVRVDLKNIQSLRGMATDASSITAMESEVATKCLEKLSKITRVTIAPYNKDVLIQSGSTITLKGREEE